MKLLVNICSHDGIISHYTGVGTMTMRYIEAFISYAINNNIDYKLNLFTPEYHEDSFGYSKKNYLKYSSLKNTTIYEIDNGSNAKINYGTVCNWQLLCSNTAKIINEIEYEKYDLVITIAHDTTFACLQNLINYHENHKTFWTVHSTIKIHEVDSAIENSDKCYDSRLKWENNAIKFINNNDNSYVIGIGNFIKKHLINEYRLFPNKIIDLYNGEFIDTNSLDIIYNNKDYQLFEKIKDFKTIILSYGRAEKYKNLESTMLLGKQMNIPTVVIAQSYYKTQPILKEYKKLAKENGTHLYIDPPFDFPKFIINNFLGNIILVVPSKKEIMGLILNEIRILKKNNVLLVANDIDGLNEQVCDGEDGILVNLDNINESSIKINNNLNNMEKLTKNGYNRVMKDYNFNKNFNKFITYVIGGLHD